MRYIDNMPTKEGGYSRTGTRTPMQWNHEKNMGFSTAFPEDLYLPLDPQEDAPCVADQLGDKTSLLETVRSLIQLRHEHEDLKANGSFKPLFAKSDCPLFLYQRGNLICGVNPSSTPVTVSADQLDTEWKKNILYSLGSGELTDKELTVGAQSFVVLA
jgi:maltose alpha-D-glucosyltransferase/alpha-amylase